MKIKQEENSLAEALKKRFKQLTLNNSIENIPICPIGITNHSNNLIFKEKFTKLSKNFLITQSTPSKYYKIFNFENNYLAHNQTNKSKTEISFFLVYKDSIENKCKVLHSLIFQHKIEGLIVGVSLSNNKENLALALALYDRNNKGKAHDYYIRIYETISKDLMKKKNDFSYNSLLSQEEILHKKVISIDLEDNNEIIQNIITKYNDVYLGNGNVVLALTIEENLVVYFRMFDDVLFNTLIKNQQKWRNISSYLTFKFTNQTVFQTIGLKFVKRNEKNQPQLLSFTIIGDSTHLMLRGDLFSLNQEIFEKSSKINNSFCNNFKFNVLHYVKSWCIEFERKFTMKKEEILEYEWEHTTNFFAKNLPFELDEVDFLKNPLFPQCYVVYDEEKGMMVAFAQNFLIINDFSKNASNPESHAYNFEYFDWNNYKIDKIKLEANKKLLILMLIKHHKKSLIIVDLARSELDQKISYLDLIQVEDIEKELDHDLIKDFHFEKIKDINEISVTFLMVNGEIKEYKFRVDHLKIENKIFSGDSYSFFIVTFLIISIIAIHAFRILNPH